jgi:UDP-glucose 4-epimerase
VPVDSRDLNYGAYLEEGDPRENAAEDFHSHNTERLDVPQVAALLERLPDFQKLIEATS